MFTWGNFSVLFSLTLLALLSACGRPGSPAGYEGQTENCSLALIKEYNGVMREGDAERKLELAKDFNDNWSGVKCTAKATLRDGSESVRSVDTSSEMDKVMQSLQGSTLRQNTGPSLRNTSPSTRGRRTTVPAEPNVDDENDVFSATSVKAQKKTGEAPVSLGLPD